MTDGATIIRPPVETIGATIVRPQVGADGAVVVRTAADAVVRVVRDRGGVNTIDGAQGDVVLAPRAAYSARATQSSSAKLLFATDIMRNFRRGAPTESWALEDGAYVIPFDWYDPSNLLTLGTKLRALIAAQKLYQFTKTGRTPTPTAPGYPKQQLGLGLELMFPNLGEMKIQPDSAAYTDVGLTYKRPWLRLENGLAIRGNKGGTSLVSYMTTSQYGIATSYRPYPEIPLRGGDINSALRGTSGAFTSSERALYVSGGTGATSDSSALDTWVYRDTCRATIDADVAAGSFTCHVTLPGDGGVEDAWYAARGLSPGATKLANKIRVGARVRRAQGQNPFDTHEVKYADFPVIVAIDGTTTAGFSKSGAQTITLDRPFLLDVVVANEFTSFPVGKNGTSLYNYLPAGSGGVENVESHSLIVVDETLLCTDPYIGDLTIVSDPTSPQKPQSAFSFQSCIRGLMENVGGFDIAQQVVDLNGAHDAVVRGLSQWGTIATSVPNTGMAFDATSCRNILIEDLFARGFPGTLAQAESYSHIIVRNGRILNDHPVASALPWFLISGDSSIELEGMWRLDGRGGLMMQRGSPDVVPSAFKMRGRWQIVVTDPANRPKIRMTDFESAASIDYDGYNLAGTARARRQFEEAVWHDRQAAKGQVGDTDIQIPLGLVCDAWLRAPASLANLTGLKILVPGSTANAISLLGQTTTHVTCPATDSLGDGRGTAADRTFTCNPANYSEVTQAVEDATIRISGFNVDGSDWYSTVESLVVVGGVIHGFVSSTLPPKPVTSGTSVAVGDGITAGKRTRLTAQASSLWVSLSAVTGTPSGSSFNVAKLEAEDASARAVLRITYASPGPVDPTDQWAVRFQTRQVLVKQGSLQASSTDPISVTGDRRGNAALTALLAEMVKRDFVRDGTVDHGAETAATAWAAATDVYAGRLYALPSGGLGYVTADRTTRATWDQTEKDAWVWIAGGHYELITASGNWKCPQGITQATLDLLAGGSGGGGGGSATTSGGTATQVGGSGGAAGTSQRYEVTGLVAGTNYAVAIGAGGTAGAGGAANNNAGANGGTGGDTTFTGPGGTVYTARGPLGGLGGSGNSAATVNAPMYGVNSRAATQFMPGAGGPALSTLGAGCSPSAVGPVGGSGGGPATATLGGIGGNARTAPGAMVSSTSGNVASGAAGGNATAPTRPGCGGAGGGGGAPGGAGGNGSAGQAGQIEARF